MAAKDRWDNPYERLANAVVIQAAKDYRECLDNIKVNPKDREAIQEALEIERFFRSKWYQALTSIDGEYLIKMLRKEVQDESERISVQSKKTGHTDKGRP